jgi:hypothetical protein
VQAPDPRVTWSTVPQYIHCNTEGLNQLETNLTVGFVLVFTLVWAGFIRSLFQETGGIKRFAGVLLLHFLPLPSLLIADGRQFYELLTYCSLGGLALILGVPRHGWPRGARTKPRLWTALGVVVAFALLIAFGATGSGA